MPNTYQLLVNGHDPGGNFVANVFHYSLSEGGTASAFEYAKALINSWTSANLAKWLALLGNDFFIDFYTAKRVSGTGGPTSQLIAGAVGLGSASSDAAGLAADIQWQTQSSNNRPGHTFVAPVPTGTFASGSWQAPYPTAVSQFITQQLTQLTLTGGLGTADFGVYTRKTKVFNIAKSGQLLTKPTMLNKRTKPQI